MKEKPESRTFEPTLFQRDEGVEPRYVIVCPCHPDVMTFTTEQALTRGISEYVAAVGQRHRGAP